MIEVFKLVHNDSEAAVKLNFNTLSTNASSVSLMPAVVTCEITLFRNYFGLRWRLSEIILPEIISKLVM